MAIGECYVAFMPPISYGGLPPRTGVILWFRPDEGDYPLVLPVLEHIGPPHTGITYKAADNVGNCEGAWEVDWDRINALESAVVNVVTQYAVGDVYFDGYYSEGVTAPIEHYTVIFDPNS